MEAQSTDVLLKSCGCNNLGELWDYIDYLESIKADYEFLKAKIETLYSTMMDLY